MSQSHKVSRLITVYSLVYSICVCLLFHRCMKTLSYRKLNPELSDDRKKGKITPSMCHPILSPNKGSLPCVGTSQQTLPK